MRYGEQYTNTNGETRKLESLSRRHTRELKCNILSENFTRLQCDKIAQSVESPINGALVLIFVVPGSIRFEGEKKSELVILVFYTYASFQTVFNFFACFANSIYLYFFSF